MKELLDKKYGRLRRSLERVRDFQLEASRLDSVLFDGTQTIDQDGTYEYVIVDNTDIEGIVKGKGSQTQPAEDDEPASIAPQTPQLPRERTESVLIKKSTKKATKASAKKDNSKKTTTVAHEKGKFQSEEAQALRKQEATAKIIEEITAGNQLTQELFDAANL